jgi:hypothetical protein
MQKGKPLRKIIETQPVELNDSELAAVAGGLSVSNSTITNSLNNVTDVSGNTVTNSFNNNTIQVA